MKLLGSQLSKSTSENLIAIKPLLVCDADLQRRNTLLVCRLVGLEQTVESRPLPDFPFVEKTVLVLGRESSGIPPQILQVIIHRVKTKSFMAAQV